MGTFTFGNNHHLCFHDLKGVGAAPPPRHVSYLSIAGIEHPDKSDFREKGSLLVYGSRGIVSIMAGKTWQQEQEPGRSHFDPYTGSREGGQEMEPGYKPSKPAPSDVLPSARL